MKPGFYVTFWQLSLYDIQYPAKNYAEAEERLKQSLAATTDSIAQLEKDNRRESHQALKVAKAKKDELLQQQAKLSAESMRHALHFEKSKARLRVEKKEWFAYHGPEAKVKLGVAVRQSQIKQLLSHCILPRTVHSPIDAIFCARFTILLHSLATTNFSTLTFFDKLFADGILYGTLLTCTLYEAENLGMFFSEIFMELSRWRDNESVFLEEALGKRVVDGQATYYPGLLFLYNEDDITEDKLVNHTTFLRAMEKWHRHTSMAIVDCLRSEDYMHRRNTITLLRSMVGVFPVITMHGLDIIDALEDIEYLDKREDLKLAARALLVHLKRCIPSWIELYDYKPVSDQVKSDIVAHAAQLANEREKKQLLRKGVKSKPVTQPAPAAPKEESNNAGRLKERTSSTSGSLPASLPRIPTGPRRLEESNSSRGGAETSKFAPSNPPPRRPVGQSARENAPSKDMDLMSTSANAIEVKARPGRPGSVEESARQAAASVEDDNRRRRAREPRRGNENSRATGNDSRDDRDARGGKRGRDQESGKSRDPENDGSANSESGDGFRKDHGDRRDDRNNSGRRGPDADTPGRQKGRATGSNAVTPVASTRGMDTQSAGESRDPSPGRGGRDRRGPRDAAQEDSSGRGGPRGQSFKNEDRPNKSEAGRGRERGNPRGRREDRPGAGDKGGSRSDNRPGRGRGAGEDGNTNRQDSRASSNTDDAPPRRPAALDAQRKGGNGPNNNSTGNGNFSETSGSWNDDRGKPANRADSVRLESRQRNEKEREKRHREWDLDRAPPPPPGMDRDRFRDRGGNDYREGGSGAPPNGGRSGRPNQREGNGGGNGGGGYMSDRKHGRNNGGRGGDYEGSGGKRRRTNR